MILISANTGIFGNRPDKERYTLFESVRLCKKAGFEAVDVNFFASTYVGLRQEHILEGENWREEVQKLNELIQKEELICYSSHSPYRNLVLSRESRELYETLLSRAIEATSIVGAKYMVVHPLMDQMHDTLIEETITYYRPWQEKALKLGVNIAMENMFSTEPEQLLYMCNELDCVACWDTGHAHIRTERQGNDIRKMGDKLLVLHIHDNYGTLDNHNPPYFGNIDWQDVMNALRDIHFKGTFNYEVNFSSLPEEIRDDIARYLVVTGKALTKDL